MLGGAEVVQAPPVVCDALRANVDAVRARFVADGLMSGEEWDAAFGSARIEIDTSDRCLPNGSEDYACTYADTTDASEETHVTTAAGFAWGGVVIRLNRDGDSLGHEAHHVLDLWQNVGNSGQHPQWSPKGYFARADDLARESWSIR